MPSRSEIDFELRNEKLIDIRRVEELKEAFRCAGRKEWFLSIVDYFSTETADALSNLACSLIMNDMRSVYRHAHLIKGVALNIGANQAVDLCVRIEFASEMGDVDKIETLRLNLATNLEDAKETLRLIGDDFVVGS